MEECKYCGEKFAALTGRPGRRDVSAEFRLNGHLRHCKVKKEQEAPDVSEDVHFDANPTPEISVDPKVVPPTHPARNRAETLEEKIERIRANREPLDMKGYTWDCPEGDGYRYKVFNDNWSHKPDRIQQAQRAGYEFVESDNDKMKPKTVGTNDDGSPITGRLMRIPQVIYDEDRAEYDSKLDKVDAQIQGGKLQESPGDNRYVPPGGIDIKSTNRETP